MKTLFGELRSPIEREIVSILLLKATNQSKGIAMAIVIIGAQSA